MKNVKHSKVKNTGMLFELLVRQITSDIITGNESVATSILKKFFNKNTELFKEYSLYRSLSDEKFQSEHKCGMLIEAVLKSRRKLNSSKLRDEKYNLIKEISSNFDIGSFFQTKVQNYKLLASIYKIFEYTEVDNPTEITRSKVTIIENMINPSVMISEETSMIANEPKEIRLLSYKLVVEKFNSKYDDLLPEQKNVLREYIENVTNTNKLTYFIQLQADKLQESLTKKLVKVKDVALRIKLTEVIGLLENYKELKRVDDNHITAIMRFYDIETDLIGVINGK